MRNFGIMPGRTVLGGNEQLPDPVTRDAIRARDSNSVQDGRIILLGNEAIIILPCGRSTIVDISDVDRVRDYPWYANTNGYVVASHYANGKKVNVYLHRLVLGAGPRQIIDHADRDRRNNRKANLRFCTVSQNCSNRAALPNATGYRGVRTDKTYSVAKYRAEIAPIQGAPKIRGPRRLSAKEAAVDYDALALEFFGSFAVLNFPVQS
jgi:hypothetical protein